jgi:AcrR family transcriptional regulator
MAKKPVQDRSRIRVDNMLTAFGQLLDEMPYHQVSTTAVAKRADSAVGSFYQFFRTKEELADALRDRLATMIVDTTKANLEGFIVDAMKTGQKVTLADCFIALHHAMEYIHRYQPGARHLPVKAPDIASQLAEKFTHHSTYDMELLNSYVLVAVASSAACTKLAFDVPEHCSDMLGLSQWALQELGKEQAP